MDTAAAVLAIVAAAAFLLLRDSSDETTLTVMSFNIYGGGVNQDKPVDETVSVIEKSIPTSSGSRRRDARATRARPSPALPRVRASR